MNQLKTFAVAGLLAATVLPAARRRHLRRRRDVSLIRSTPNGRTPIRKRPASGSTISRSAPAAASSKSRPETVMFGATDAPLKGADLDKSGLVQFPMVMGGIVPVVNLEGVKAGRPRARRPDARQDLPRRDQDLGRCRRSRSSIRTPSCRRRPIAVVHRSDGSGTTFNFTDYLSKVSPDWKSKVGSATVGRMAGRHRRQGQ